MNTAAEFRIPTGGRHSRDQLVVYKRSRGVEVAKPGLHGDIKISIQVQT